MKKAKVFDIVAETINYIIICYALANMAYLFRASLLYILFFASDVWITGNYWRKVKELTDSKVIAAILLLLSFIVLAAMVYFIGRVSGTVIPYYS